MKFDARLEVPLGGVGAEAAEYEAGGYAGLWSAEAGHDPFLGIAVAAGHTARADLGTGVAVALSRSPMTVAYTGWDLQALSRGRFILGLGSQTKPHIQRRFGMGWDRPVARMREFVRALQAIWESWQTGTALDFRGEFYTHTLMPPLFAPARTELQSLGPPRIFLGGVGPMMTEMAGEVADGFICGFTSERYLREVTLPALARGRARAGRGMAGFEIVAQALGSIAVDDRERERAVAAAREQIAFFGSTPTYRGVLDLYGWGDLHDDLHRLSRQGRWPQMTALIDDDMVDRFAVVGTPRDLVAELTGRFAGLAQRLIVAPPPARRDDWYAVLAEHRSTLGQTPER